MAQTIDFVSLLHKSQEYMLVSEDVISNITLSGNMYDDWYVGRK